jgi:hypothetical protein
MANIKLPVFPKKTNHTGERRVYVQLTHNRKATWIATSIYVKPEAFDRGRINPKRDPNASHKNIALSETLAKYEKK